VKEQVHRVGQQGQPQNDLESTRSQDEPYARRGEDAYAEGKHDFHQTTSPLASSSSHFCGLSGVRIDWCAMAIRMRAVAPMTRKNTPRSNSSALATGTFPMIGMSA